MNELSPVVQSFLAKVSEFQQLWGLQDPDNEEWLVCDSAQFEEADVMPLWSEQALAQSHCNEDWAGFIPAAISVDEFLEYWVDDLNQDDVLVGIDWRSDDDCEEIEAFEIGQLLADVEAEED
ncbi:DUF2750 domain-containing protein [Shewanella yunxiaonensis]|uniref:DUF2750 domain-containing protein n=1 Tax=Shewanella yunxiaonensis TaxID=2829809 RepID=A0ABX7YYM8_9GAMM|nr:MULTISPECIES: DUF2750 domain-containing protein [Shewanella]MDF0534896.1 DUF2750 domain-containing protein [Shewanella sp. A32]QUN07281.1 DUF2750 domain-containing protein [Shewanella yunxiaonensis]